MSPHLSPLVYTEWLVIGVIAALAYCVVALVAGWPL